MTTPTSLVDASRLTEDQRQEREEAIRSKGYEGFQNYVCGCLADTSSCTTGMCCCGLIHQNQQRLDKLHGDKPRSHIACKDMMCSCNAVLRQTRRIRELMQHPESGVLMDCVCAWLCGCFVTCRNFRELAGTVEPIYYRFMESNLSSGGGTMFHGSVFKSKDLPPAQTGPAVAPQQHHLQSGYPHAVQMGPSPSTSSYQHPSSNHFSGPISSNSGPYPSPYPSTQHYVATQPYPGGMMMSPGGPPATNQVSFAPPTQGAHYQAQPTYASPSHATQFTNPYYHAAVPSQPPPSSTNPNSSPYPPVPSAEQQQVYPPQQYAPQQQYYDPAPPQPQAQYPQGQPQPQAQYPQGQPQPQPQQPQVQYYTPPQQPVPYAQPQEQQQQQQQQQQQYYPPHQPNYTTPPPHSQYQPQPQQPQQPQQQSQSFLQ